MSYAGTGSTEAGSWAQRAITATTKKARFGWTSLRSRGPRRRRTNRGYVSYTYLTRCLLISLLWSKYCRLRHSSNSVGSVLVGEINAHTLFDTGATHSFVSPTLTKCWNFEGMFVSNAKGIETVGTELMMSTGTYEDVSIVIESIELKGNLVEMELNHYQVILGIDSLTYHKAVMDCPKTHVYIPRTEGKIIFRGIKRSTRIPIISMMQA